MGKDAECASVSKMEKKKNSCGCTCIYVLIVLLMMMTCVAVVLYMCLEMKQMREEMMTLRNECKITYKVKDNNDNEKGDWGNWQQKNRDFETKLTLLESWNARQARLINGLRRQMYRISGLVTEAKFTNELVDWTTAMAENNSFVRQKRDVANNQVDTPVQPAGETMQCLQGVAGKDGRDGRDGIAGTPGRDGRDGLGIAGEELQKMLMAFKNSDTESKKIDKSLQNVTSGGAVYIRWGRTSCPSSANLVYDGIAAGSYYTHTGGGSEKLCLPHDPQWGKFQDGTQGRASIYGAEYEAFNNVFSFENTNGIRNHDVPCAVCHTENRPTHMMIPAWKECPARWTKEYTGYLMTSHYNYQRSSFNCIDEAPEVLPGGQSNVNGALFYAVEAQCGSLPCPNYVEGRELTCVVCTK